MALSLFRDPFNEIRELDRMLNTAIDFPTIPGPITTRWAPRSDLRETDKEYILSCELPGVKKEDIKVELNDDILSVSGEKKIEKKEENEKYHRVERSYGKFSRALSVPKGLKEDQIKCSYQDGVLNVVFPKIDQKQQVKRITIS